MSTVAEIRNAIEKLSLEERTELLSGLVGFEDDDWDRQMKADAAAGKFQALNQQAEAEFRAGTTRPIADSL